MKKIYIHPKTDVVVIRMDSHLMTISGNEEQLNGGSNGDYDNGVTLGAREGGFWDEEEE